MTSLDPAQQLANATNALAIALSSLPRPIMAVSNTTILGNELVALSHSLAPLMEALSPALTESLLTNLTFVRENLESLDVVLSKLPQAELARSSFDELVQLVAIGATKFTLRTVWAPEVWS
jgi:hypothetical protein